MIDAIDLLLQDKPQPDAQKLLAFHHANPEFLPRIVAEFRLLKRLGRKAGGAKSLIHFLRWDRHWEGIDDFEINDHLRPLAIRVCALLWPDINGMVQFRHCGADDILGVRIARRGKRYGNFLYPGKRTLTTGVSFLPPERNGAGLVRPIREEGFPIVTTMPPEVPALDRPATFHSLITEVEALSIAAPLRGIVDNSPTPRHPTLLAWLDHVEAQPEIFAFMEKTLLERNPARFSANSILEYARWSIRRRAESHKRFTLPNKFGGLYCRALIMLNPQFNGLCEFREDCKGLNRAGNSNRHLGCSLASEPINGEPYRRLLWKVVAK